MTHQTYTIGIGNLDNLLKYVKRINKRAKANGISGIDVIVLEETKRLKESVVIASNIDPWLDKKIKVPVVDVEIHGTLPVVRGYSFVASVEKTDSGNLVLGGSDHDLSQYYDSELYCDHCKTRRNRKKTIIVETPDKDLIQVGRSCVKDFLGVNFENELKTFESLVTFIRTENEESDRLGNGFYGYGIEVFLSYTAAQIRSHGWVSSGHAFGNNSISTKTSVLNALDSRSSYEIEVQDEDVEVAKKALEWILSVTPDSDFLHNTQIVAKNGFVTWKTAGFAAAIIKGYETHLSKINAKENQVDFTKSQFVGTIGKRIEAKVKVISKKVIESYYGVNTVITFVTPEGNILTTFASGSISNVERDEELTIKGTVKKHNVFRDSNQTILNRVVVV